MGHCEVMMVIMMGTVMGRFTSEMWVRARIGNTTDCNTPSLMWVLRAREGG